MVPRKKRPQIYRVDISRNNNIRVYILKTKVSEYNMIAIEYCRDFDDGMKKEVAGSDADLGPKISLRRITSMSEKLSLLNIKEGEISH